MTSSKTGYVETINDEQFLILNIGQRVEQVIGEQEIKISDFKEYGTRISKSIEESEAIPPKAISSWHLLNNPTKRNMGELAWRLGLMFAAFNLLIIALAITSANHRVGRGGNLALALFAFVVYYNFINMSQSWVGSGKFQFLPLLIVLHGGVLLLALSWLMVRHNNWSWRQLLPQSSGEAASQ
jgi:lipopolysaccharide export system permease protein